MMKKNTILFLVLILLMTVAWKIGLLWLNLIPFNSDEAVVALMARHILTGERPIFFYGQAYMGSLDAYLVAAGFAIFGQQVWVIRAIQTLLYLFTIITTVLIADTAFKSIKTGLLAASLLAIPTVNVTLYTTVSLGGYGEALLLGNLLLLVGINLYQNLCLPTKVQNIQVVFLGLIWGVLAGVGLWANGLTLVYSLPMGSILLWSISKNCNVLVGLKIVFVIILGFFIGSLPWWIFAYQNGLSQLMMELSGNAVSVENEHYLVRSFNHLVSLVVLGGTVTLGLRPPWGVNWLGLPLIPFVLIIWGAVVWIVIQNLAGRGKKNFGYFVLVSMMVTLFFGFIFSSFGVDPSGRYFLPAGVGLVLLAGDTIQKLNKKILVQMLLIGFILVFQILGTVQCALSNPPGITTQFYNISIIDHNYDKELISFLKSKGEKYGYTNYWVAYPLAFISQEELIFIPRLPYHPDLRYTERDDRYEPYRKLVGESTRVAYITTNNPILDTALRDGFSKSGITWQEKEIGDYLVFYELSEIVSPSQIGLGFSDK